MTTYDPQDGRRPTDTTTREERSSGMAWGGIAVVAMLIIGGLAWYTTRHTETGTRTASVPMTTQNAPASPPASAPANPTPPAAPRQ